MTHEQAPKAPAIDARRYPLIWLQKELNTPHTLVGNLDKALFFDTSIEFLASGRGKYQVEVASPFHEYGNNSPISYGDFDPNGGDHAGKWPKLRWSNFEMSVYEKPNNENQLKEKRLVRKITVEQNAEGTARRVFLEGRMDEDRARLHNDEDSPWIGVNVQFDLLPDKGWQQAARLTQIGFTGYDSKAKIHRAASLRPRYNPEAGALWTEDVEIWKGNRQDDKVKTRVLTHEEAEKIVKTKLDEKTVVLEMRLGTMSVHFPLPVELIRTNWEVPATTDPK